MNERIKELAELAGAIEYSSGTGMGNAMYIENADELNKFAELIVRECQQICNSFSEECYPNESHAEAIGQHFFGVE
jgi:hypothetical protein